MRFKKKPIVLSKILLTKEPEIIEWINGFDEKDVFWDIGADVGIYSLYAALRGIKTLAFEPTPGKNWLLSKNVALNGFGDKISSYCVAFSNKTKLDSFCVANTEPEGVEIRLGDVDWKGEFIAPKHNQPRLHFTIDYFIRQFRPLFPNHIKIVGDEIEMKIIDGARATLVNKAIKSVLIERNARLDESNKIIAMMKTHGLTLFKQKHAPICNNGQYSNRYNHLFVR